MGLLEILAGFGRLLGQATGAKPAQLPCGKDVWEAIQNGGELEIESEDVSQEFNLNPRTVEVAKRLDNEQTNIAYLRTRAGKEIRESLITLVARPKKRGGLTVRFTDGTPVSWQRMTASHWWPVPEHEHYWYKQALGSARKAAGIH